MSDFKTLLGQLSVPFAKTDIAWRPGKTLQDNKRAQALPYAEPRVYEDVLNRVCPGDWSVIFKPWGDSRLMCELTIYGVTRSSTGEFDDGKKNAIAEGTVAEAQAFKRACSKFGLGRYLYDIPISWVDYDADKKRLTDTPVLPDKYLPKPVPAANPAANVGVIHEPPLHESPLRNPSPVLDSQRAEAMSYELEKLGHPKRDQLRLASSVLEKPVRALATLTEVEALEVWSYAKRVYREAA